MRKNNVTYDEVLTLENLRDAWKSVKKTCKNKKRKYRYQEYLNCNIENLYRELKNEAYKPRPYYLFLIYEPKPRLVMSQTIQDKVINHFITKRILIPNLEKKLIDQNIATRKGKGGMYGNKIMKDYINSLRQTGNVYCLKMDIKKYFYNISHARLLEKLKKDNIDNKTINLIELYLTETNEQYVNQYIDKVKAAYKKDIPHYKKNVGLSIGAVINQFLAIYYLNDLDHYIKEKLHAKHYVRYMDDLIILDNDKKKLKDYRKIIEEFLKKEELEVNAKSTIVSLKNGINFLGVRHYELNGKYRRTFRKTTLNKVRHHLQVLEKKDKIQYHKSLASYNGYFKLVKNKEMKEDFKMKTIEKYELNKEEYKNALILVKEGVFYKTYGIDAKIIWYLFDYVYQDSVISFGSKAYQRVFDELNRIKMSYVIVEETIQKNVYKNEIYTTYSQLAEERFEEEAKIKKLQEKIEMLMNQNEENYQKIETFLKQLES